MPLTQAQKHLRTIAATDQATACATDWAKKIGVSAILDLMDMLADLEGPDALRIIAEDRELSEMVGLLVILQLKQVMPPAPQTKTG